MMTDSATAIKREVVLLVDQQIEILQREGRISDRELDEYRSRSGEITRLYGELDRIVRSRISPLAQLAQAS